MSELWAYTVIMSELGAFIIIMLELWAYTVIKSELLDCIVIMYKLTIIMSVLSFQSHGPYYHVNTLSLYSFHVRRMDQAGRKHGKFH